MKYYDKITPDGTKDRLFEECARRSQVTNTLKELFASRGYRRVMTPVLEFYDVYGKSANYLPQDMMYKLTDTKGRLMVLCPDCTVPIARLTATRLQGMPMPLRLYYSHNIYRMYPDLKGKSTEIHQMGIELIGSSSIRSDLEAVELAADSLMGIDEKYRLELCHIGYFKALMESLNADEETKEAVRLSVEQKNYGALTELLRPYEGNRAAEALKKLPRLFGGAEVLEKAYELFDENGARESLDYLKKVYEHLEALGLKERVMLDLGLVNQAEYYTGIIFRGYFDGIGAEVLSGGRYDKLLRDFGEDLPAVGFAVNVDQASLKAKEPSEEQTKVLVFAEREQDLARAGRYFKELTAKGIKAENCVFDRKEDAVSYGKAAGIAELHVIGEQIRVESLKAAEDETKLKRAGVEVN